jgi:predicted branched-subunit amino acid permease
LSRKICRNTTVTVLAAISFLLLLTKSVSAVIIVIGGAVCGLLLTWLRRTGEPPIAEEERK